MEQFKSQSQTGHARALARQGETWNFGSGLQAITPVVRVNVDYYKELGITKYTRTNRDAMTPGHVDTKGVPYKVYDPGAQILRCFQCHSTGPLRLTEKEGIQPFEMGVTCETCHGPGADHVRDAQRKWIEKDDTVKTDSHIDVPDKDNCLQCHNTDSPTWDPKRYTLEDGTTTGFDYRQAKKRAIHPASDMRAAK